MQQHCWFWEKIMPFPLRRWDFPAATTFSFTDSIQKKKKKPREVNKKVTTHKKLRTVYSIFFLIKPWFWCRHGDPLWADSPSWQLQGSCGGIWGVVWVWIQPGPASAPKPHKVAENKETTETETHQSGPEHSSAGSKQIKITLLALRTKVLLFVCFSSKHKFIRWGFTFWIQKFLWILRKTSQVWEEAPVLLSLSSCQQTRTEENSQFWKLKAQVQLIHLRLLQSLVGVVVRFSKATALETGQVEGRTDEQIKQEVKLKQWQQKAKDFSRFLRGAAGSRRAAWWRWGQTCTFHSWGVEVGVGH